MWVAWVTTLPLYLYTCITPVFGQPPSSLDASSLVLIVLVVISGFCTNIPDMSETTTRVVLTFGNGFFIACCYCLYLSKNALPKIPETESKASIKRNLTILMCILVPLYPVVYYLACGGFIDSDATSVLFSGLSLVVKGLFGMIVSDLDIKTFYTLEASLTFELEAKSKRREFLRYMFHELRIPLNAISMSVSLCKDSRPEMSRNYLEDLSEYVNFMDCALERYMLVEKIQESSFVLSSEPFHLGALWDKIDAYAGKKSCEVQVVRRMTNTESLPVVVEGDLRMLDLSFANLISQAVGRMPDKSVLVLNVCDATSAADRKQKKCRIGIDFEDFGPHMSEKEVENLFLPFSHLMLGDMITSASNLGLFVAKEVLSRYSSDVVVQSKADMSGMKYHFDICLPISTIPEPPCIGSTELLTQQQQILPLTPVIQNDENGEVLCRVTRSRALRDKVLPAVQVKKDDTLASIRSPLKQKKDPIRVLVVDGTSLCLLPCCYLFFIGCIVDATSNRKLLQRMLLQKDITADGAVDGSMAVDMVKSSSYDLIFMDFSMPVMVIFKP